MIILEKSDDIFKNHNESLSLLIMNEVIEIEPKTILSLKNDTFSLSSFRPRMYNIGR